LTERRLAAAGAPGCGYDAAALPSIPHALLLLLVGLSACASGGDDGGAYPGDDGGTTGSDGAGDASRDATSVDGSADTSTVDDTGTAPTDDASADTSPVEGGGGSDANPVEAAPDDSSSTCANHGFSGALVTFDLSALAGNEASAAATSSAAGVTGGALSRAAGLTATSGAGSINSSGWSTATTPDMTLYYTFTVTPAAGCTVGLTSLALDVQASSTGPKHVEVGTSADGYATLSTPVAGTSSGSVPLSANAAAAVTVHVFGYGASSTAGTLRIQNTMTLSGTLE
jgi:hypothetical protein